MRNGGKCVWSMDLPNLAYPQLLEVPEPGISGSKVKELKRIWFYSRISGPIESGSLWCSSIALPFYILWVLYPTTPLPPHRGFIPLFSMEQLFFFWLKDFSI